MVCCKIAAVYPETFDKLQKLREDLKQRVRTGPVPKTLYHYTDAAGLLGIVMSGTVWATHSAYLNDASEFQYGVALMEKVAEEATAKAKPNTWEALCLEAISLNAIEQRDRDSAQATEGEQFFVTCFSAERDRLSQWRGYGKSIGGYALGFPFKHLGAIEKRINDSQVGKTYDELNPRIRVEFGRCLYDPKEQKKLLKGALDEILRNLKEKHPAPNTSFDPDPSIPTYIRRLSDPVHRLTGALKVIPRVVSPYFKDPAFREEREWRLVVSVGSPRGVSGRLGHDRERAPDDIRMDEVATVNYRKGEYSLVPYIVLPLVLNAELTQVVVGPTPLPENARAAAMQLLRPKPERSRTPIPAPADQRLVCKSENIISSRIPFRRV